MRIGPVIGVFREAARRWWGGNTPRFAAALAYYAAFSLAPLVILGVAIAGLVYGPEAATGELGARLRETVGPQVAAALQDVVRSMDQSGAGRLATVVSVLVLLVGAATFFAELQATLNDIWGVTARTTGLKGLVVHRLWAFVMVLLVGALLIAALGASTAVAAVEKYLGPALPGGSALLWALQVGVSLALVTALFALVYRVLPDVHLRWADVGVGAALTAVLFAAGNALIGLYLGRTSAASAYGAAGSLAVILLWVYYSAQVFLFGAEFTYVYAHRFGRPAVDTGKARPADSSPAPGR
jgi:membrane protein